MPLPVIDELPKPHQAHVAAAAQAQLPRAQSGGATLRASHQEVVLQVELEVAGFTTSS